VVKVAGQLNYIDSLGKVILTTPLEWFSDALNVAKFSNGFAVFRKKEKFGLIDVNGKVIQKPILYLFKYFIVSSLLCVCVYVRY
jgi:hypothetical protein